jgi:hypothetical protein
MLVDLLNIISILPSDGQDFAFAIARGLDTQSQSISRVFSNAEVKALPTTPITIIPSPNDGSLLIPFRAFLGLRSVAGYTNFDITFSLKLNYQAPGVDKFSFGSGVDLILGSASNVAMPYTLGGADSFTGIAPSAINKPLQLSATNGAAGNLTGGNAANSLLVTVFFVSLNV